MMFPMFRRIPKEKIFIIKSILDEIFQSKQKIWINIKNHSKFSECILENQFYK